MSEGLVFIGGLKAVVLSLSCTLESPGELFKIVNPRNYPRPIFRISGRGSQALVVLKVLQVTLMCNQGSKTPPLNLSLGEIQLLLGVWIKIYSNAQVEV